MDSLSKRAVARRVMPQRFLRSSYSKDKRLPGTSASVHDHVEPQPYERQRFHLNGRGPRVAGLRKDVRQE